ncbi:putative SP-containing membrane protein [Vairimorpha necatrix]|uniref:SP-containing membrane protein n=1 Tax=Vairimorpha necatrix TaxID=6039 RepID=A0AAX4JEL5_9MICR
MKILIFCFILLCALSVSDSETSEDYSETSEDDYEYKNGDVISNIKKRVQSLTRDKELQKDSSSATNQRIIIDTPNSAKTKVMATSSNNTSTQEKTDIVSIKEQSKNENETDEIPYDISGNVYITMFLFIISIIIAKIIIYLINLI